MYVPGFPSEEIEGWTLGHDWQIHGIVVYIPECICLAIGDSIRDWQIYGVVVYVPVPDTSTGLKLGYRDLPLIDLEPVPYVPEE